MTGDLKNQKNLVDYLVTARVLYTPIIIDAFKAVDRRDFVPPKALDFVYYDEALRIGYEQTISQPTTVAIMLELLQPQKGQRILDIGSGSGWTTALLSFIVGDTGSVIGLEIIPQLVKFGQKNLAKYNFLQSKIVQARKSLGLPGKLFDRILISASAKQIPDELIDQLKLGGKMVTPVEYSLMLVEKDLEGNVTQKEIPGFTFVVLK
ncbi:MAG: protein-L-isoaspartate O-methyltransferase [Patescibacteria group bacterium]